METELWDRDELFTIAVTHSKDKEELAYTALEPIVLSQMEIYLLKEGGADVIPLLVTPTRQQQIQLKHSDQIGRIILMGVSTTDPLAISPEILFKRGHIIGSTQMIGSTSMKR